MDGKQDASFFDPENTAGVRKRTELAMQCLDDMIAWFEKGGGLCGIYDATNSTRTRRAFVKARLAKFGVRVLFLESICTDSRIVDRNIMDTKLRSPDYRGMDPDEAANDFRSRREKYTAANETLSEDEQSSYVKVINVGKQLILNEIRGYLQGKIVSFLLNTHISPRSIFLTRAGESENLVSGKLGGDPSLTPNGKRYSHALTKFMRKESENNHCLKVWTSQVCLSLSILFAALLTSLWNEQLKRTRETVAPMGLLSVCWRALNEIDAGICEGLTYGEIESQHPDVARDRKNNKLRYRYPQGESYIDLIHRLEPVILELERTRAPMLVVAHNAVIRCMLAYFTGKSQEECPFIDIPMNTVFKLTTRAYGVEVERFNILKEGKQS